MAITGQNSEDFPSPILRFTAKILWQGWGEFRTGPVMLGGVGFGKVWFINNLVVRARHGAVGQGWA